MAAPKENRNAVKHGKYGFLAIGSLPKGASYIRRLLGEFQRHLERCVGEKYGEINTMQAALIQSAVRHEARAQLVTRWLREGFDKLSAGDKLNHVREISTATDARDKALKSLGLDKCDTEDLLSSLYSPRTSPMLLTEGNGKGKNHDDG